MIAQTIFAQIKSLDAQTITHSAAVLLILSIIVIVAVLFLFIWIGWWAMNRDGSASPYAGRSMRRGKDLAYRAVRAVQDYMESYQQPENPLFNVSKSAICRDTGRVFPDSINIWEIIHVDWKFLRKRHPGRWASWGSLNELEQKEVRACHGSMEGYQVELSSPVRLPEKIESTYALAKPGPLYVDLDSKALLGWKCVPNTELEVMIVRLPIEPMDIPLDSVWKAGKGPRNTNR